MLAALGGCVIFPDASVLAGLPPDTVSIHARFHLVEHGLGSVESERRPRLHPVSEHGHVCVDIRYVTSVVVGFKHQQRSSSTARGHDDDDDRHR